MTFRNRQPTRISHWLSVVVVVFIQASTIQSVQADTIELTMTPSSCVALNQGQLCYQTISVKWQVPLQAEYCLFQRPSIKPLACWNSSRSGKAELEFESAETVIYDLKLSGSTQAIAETEIEVTWVYSKRKRRRTSWRLF